MILPVVGFAFGSAIVGFGKMLFIGFAAVMSAILAIIALVYIARWAISGLSSSSTKQYRR
jgi:hypothetical protein